MVLKQKFNNKNNRDISRFFGVYFFYYHINFVKMHHMVKSFEILNFLKHCNYSECDVISYPYFKISQGVQYHHKNVTRGCIIGCLPWSVQSAAPPLKHWENTLSYRSPRRGFPRVHRRQLHRVALMILFSSWTVLSSVLDVTSVLLSCHAQNQGKFKLVRRTNSRSWRLWFYHANALAIFFSFFFLWNEILSNTS